MASERKKGWSLLKSYKGIYNQTMKARKDVHAAAGDELETIQVGMLKIMDDVIRVCDKYGLCVMLTAGTCLGAVRHGGFIPWDDDIDLMMPRQDYERFKQLFTLELGDRYRLSAPNYGSDSPLARFGKVIDENIVFAANTSDKGSAFALDIFPIENVPENPIIRYLHGARAQLAMMCAGAVGFCGVDGNFKKGMRSSSFSGLFSWLYRSFVGKVCSFMPLGSWFNLVDSCVQYRKASTLRGIPAGRTHYFGEILDESVFFPCIEVLFEGHKAYIPHKVDMYLSNLYGDYMTIPPEEKREHHYIPGVIVDGQRV